jgi:GNAT superfamily N-acetyltransferase
MAPVVYIEASPAMRDLVADNLGPGAAEHMQFEDGFSLLAFEGDVPVGVIAVSLHPLPRPLHDVEGFIEFVEVKRSRRKQGIASGLVSRAVARCRESRAVQLRAWSSEDRVAALAMWKALGFGLCPGVKRHEAVDVEGFYALLPLSSGTRTA